MDKFSKHVAFNHIQIEEFWRSNKIFATLEEFIDFLNQIGIMPSKEEVEEFAMDLLNEDGYVTIKKLCQQVESWRNNENAMLEFIREKALQIAQGS